SSVENPFSLLPHITDANRSPVPEKLTSKKCDLWVVVPFAVVTRLYIKGAVSSLHLIPVMITTWFLPDRLRSFSLISVASGRSTSFLVSLYTFSIS
ncbi:hypothetical protein, partial [Agathobacter rectalis]|uniref:hypothetical protein n=1 Tax=Agathobacter rectalis TaxID=39491 RepID=UPI0027D21984